MNSSELQVSGFLRHPSEVAPLTSVLKGLRICFVAGTLGQGGAERQLYYILRSLKEAGSDISLLCLTKREYWEAELRALGIQVEFVGGSRSRLRRLLTIIRAVRRLRPQILQSQHFYTNGYAAIAARLTNTCCFGGIRNDVVNEVRSSGRGFGTICLRLPDRLVANSQAALRTLQTKGLKRSKLHYLPNVIDLSRFRPSVRQEASIPCILAVGRLVAQKRFDRFLKILAILRRESSIPFKAVIAGDGPLRSALERQAQDFGLTPSIVQFKGQVDKVELLFRFATLLLVTSDHEGTPNVVMEAMASGLPVVATAVGDVPALLQHGVTGYIVDPAAEQTAAQHLHELLLNQPLRQAMGVRARDFIRNSYSVEALPGHLENLYFGRLA